MGPLKISQPLILGSILVYKDSAIGQAGPTTILTSPATDYIGSGTNHRLSRLILEREADDYRFNYLQRKDGCS
jgi:hypothetical protein